MNNQFLADKIFNELDRLGISTNQNPYSGLMVDDENLLVEGRPEVVAVKIYDDYADGVYDGNLVLSHLKTLSPGEVDLDSESLSNVWQSIQAFEI